MPSSVILRFRYDISSHTLRVWFVSGIAYDYKKIPEAVYNKLITASSKGKFLNEEIKGKYSYEKVN
jgi:KTSC domain